MEFPVRVVIEGKGSSTFRLFGNNSNAANCKLLVVLGVQIIKRQGLPQAFNDLVAFCKK